MSIFNSCVLDFQLMRMDTYSYWTSDFLHFPSSKILGEGFTTETCIEENCCGVEKKPASEGDCYDSFSVAVMKFTCN